MRLNYREINWLRASAIGAGSGLYAGEYWDNAPKTFAKLERMGLVRLLEPHNHAHKARAVITGEGRAALQNAQLSERAPKASA